MTRSVSSTIVIHAPAERIFALLQDPRRHTEFDGSGTVRASVKGPEKLAKGDRFGMSMRRVVPYTITNEVVELVPDRTIAWRHFGRHVWRYDLAPVEGGTEVTETFDWSGSRSPRTLEMLDYPAKNAAAIEQTLQRLKALVETG